MANKKNPVVLASGVFDLLHLGHVKFLQEAKASGGKNAKLIVIIARDSTVEKIKGKKPIMAEDQRCALVEALKVVDKAVLGAENFDVGDVIGKVKPDIIALGYDQDDMNRQVQKYVAEHKSSIKVVRIGKFGQNALDSSSKIKQKIIENKMSQ
jgi:FAD synthetase